MKNKDIRQAVQDANLKYWQVAHGLGISDGHFSRKLRIEFSTEDKELTLQTINKLVKERDESA